MLKRKALDAIASWKNSPAQTALLVTGARQTGKTYIIREFGRTHYRHFIEINLIESPDLLAVFENTQSARDILMRLSLATDQPLVSGETLIFIDEVQESPEIVTAIKFLVDEGNYDYILSGSLLGVELNDIRSVPVGYLSVLKMYPLDFEEFCWASNISDEILGALKECFQTLKPVDDFIHARLLDLFNRYLIIGGMPNAVSVFLATNDLAKTRTVQDDIKRLYRQDISKYAEQDKLTIKEIYDLVPSELNNPNKRFVLKNLNENARFRSYQNDFSWLIKADVAIAAYNVDEPCQPLLLSKQRNLFKLFYSDVGLLTSSFLRKASLDVLSGNENINYGSTFENAVAQELWAHGFNLYYYNGKKQGEVDFLIEDKDGTVTPLEVKSGKAYTRHSALSNILQVKNYGLKRGYVLGPGNIVQQGKIIYLPVYLTAFFDNR
ncbi:MAG: ATP-binding protein [Coriobacteriales bacterium]|jgi:predicted AAA+ superfamily ATPase|nr:ATP-binding protein [Coriobacteriales bacterium]